MAERTRHERRSLVGGHQSTGCSRVGLSPCYSLFTSRGTIRIRRHRCNLGIVGETIARVLNHSEGAIGGITVRYNRASARLLRPGHNMSKG